MAVILWSLLSAILCSSFLLSKAQICPSMENCTYQTHPKCNFTGIESNRCLRSAMERINYAGKTTLILHKIKIPTGLEGRAFDRTQFTTLIFKDFDIGNINASNESPFQGDQQIERLYFLNSTRRLVLWKNSAVHVAKLKLTELVFSGLNRQAFANTDKLPAWFSNFDEGNVRFLEISASCLTQLDSWSMSSFKKVERISLIGNSIATIQSNAFPETSTLKVINLAANHLSILDEKTFNVPELSGLQDVFLQNNVLTSVPRNAVPKTVKRFHIHDNHQLICNQSIIWLLNEEGFEWEAPNGLHATCKEPEKLSGCALAKLKEEDINACSRPDADTCTRPPEKKCTDRVLKSRARN